MFAPALGTFQVLSRHAGLGIAVYQRFGFARCAFNFAAAVLALPAQLAVFLLSTFQYFHIGFEFDVMPNQSLQPTGRAVCLECYSWSVCPARG